MGLIQTLNDLEFIDLARAEIEKHRDQNNPLLPMLEMMTDLAERAMGPKPKPKRTWSQVWDKFDTMMRCDK